MIYLFSLKIRRLKNKKVDFFEVDFEKTQSTPNTTFNSYHYLLANMNFVTNYLNSIHIQTNIAVVYASLISASILIFV